MLLSTVTKKGKYIITGIKEHRIRLNLMELGFVQGAEITVADRHTDGAALIILRGDMLSLSALPSSLIEVEPYGKL